MKGTVPPPTKQYPDISVSHKELNTKDGNAAQRESNYIVKKAPNGSFTAATPQVGINQPHLYVLSLTESAGARGCSVDSKRTLCHSELSLITDKDKGSRASNLA